jgi:hypothetical protein
MFGLLGGLAGKSEPSKPTGKEAYWMEVTANQSDGIPVGFTTYRRPDITGQFPEWFQTFVKNYGDVDDPPVGVPMGPRHRSITARSPMPPGD